jgi:hypothetical protein
MVQNMLFCFTNISAEILLLVLGYSICTKCHILVHFCQMLLPSKSSNYHRKSCSTYAPKNAGEIDPQLLLYLPDWSTL